MSRGVTFSYLLFHCGWVSAASEGRHSSTEGSGVDFSLFERGGI